MTTTTNTASQTNFRLFVLFALLVFSTGVFAQKNTTRQVSVDTTTTIVTPSTEKAVAASTDFAVWFMGTKQTSNNTTNSSNFGKKQLINAGVNTNSVLIRSFLKKVISQESSVA